MAAAAARVSHRLPSNFYLRISKYILLKYGRLRYIPLKYVLLKYILLKYGLLKYVLLRYVLLMSHGVWEVVCRVASSKGVCVSPIVSVTRNFSKTRVLPRTENPSFSENYNILNKLAQPGLFFVYFISFHLTNIVQI